MNWTDSTDYKIGDTVTAEGLYHRRTFWQWLTGKPRQLVTFEAIGVHHD